MSVHDISETSTSVSHPFFEATDRDGALVINFLTSDCSGAASDGKSPDRVRILPRMYEEFRSLADRIKGRPVIATGRGPVEGYFAVGYYATLFGAAGVSFEGPNGKNCHAMPAADAVPADKVWLRFETTDDGVVASLEKAPRAEGKWEDSEIDYTRPAVLPTASGRVTFTGLGAVSMYLLLGVSAARAGLSDVCVKKPSDPYVIRFTPDRAGETLASSGGKKGVVVGIIGDPNSGKSVFSRAFSMALRNIMPQWFQPWIYDCDLASPTPEWYLSPSDPSAKDAYDNLRKTQKVPWSNDLEHRCAKDLNVLRTNLDIVIADLPGGLHKDGDGNALEHPIRVGTESRADMFRQCDAFILICRKNDRERILNGWRAALAEFGLEDRLLAILNSDKHKEIFSVSPMEPDERGIILGEFTGLDRPQFGGEMGKTLAASVHPLVRALTAIPVVNAARAATVTAFLTGTKGTRYGAAVRSASTGRIFSAGQYSSYNHSTNMHAEMNALSQAAMAGEPDVDMLAITSTSPDGATPCGVCRQVILEHATRTGRDFDVVLTKPGTRPVIMTASELLPHAWQAHRTAASADVREYADACSGFTDAPPVRIGSEIVVPPSLLCDSPRMALIWDGAFAPNTVLCKYKYEQMPDGRWLKLPHAFAESAAYLRYLVDKRCGSTTFPGLSSLRMPLVKERAAEAGYRFKHPIPVPEDRASFFAEALFGPAGIDVKSSVTVTCSRMTGLATEGSDWDLCVAATPEQIKTLRARVVELAETGRVTFPDKSRSWKLVKDGFPGATADGGKRLRAELRYADSFRLDGIPVSFLFVPPCGCGARLAFPTPYTSAGRITITGRVLDAARAAYKRSESVVETVDRRRVRLLCYHKTGNLLKEGDSIAATGVLCRHAAGADVLDCAETLVLSAPAVDRIVWLP